MATRNFNNLLIQPHLPPLTLTTQPPQTATLMEELSQILRSPASNEPAPFSAFPHPSQSQRLPPLSATFPPQGLQRATTFPARAAPPTAAAARCKRCSAPLQLPPSVATLAARLENRSPPLAVTNVPRTQPRCKSCDVASTQALCRTISSSPSSLTSPSQRPSTSTSTSTPNPPPPPPTTSLGSTEAIKKIKTDMAKMEEYRSQGVMVKEMEVSILEAKKRLETLELAEKKRVERMNKAWEVFAGVWGREEARRAVAKGGLTGAGAGMA